jgi:predicted CoA-binding protein
MAKSINVFKKAKVIPVSATKKRNKTIGSEIIGKKFTGAQYQKYCEIIDEFAKAKSLTGSQAEASLFDARRPWEQEGVWRQEVQGAWEQFSEIKHRKEK